MVIKLSGNLGITLHTSPINFSRAKLLANSPSLSLSPFNQAATDMVSGGAALPAI